MLRLTLQLNRLLELINQLVAYRIRVEPESETATNSDQVRVASLLRAVHSISAIKY